MELNKVLLNKQLFRLLKVEFVEVLREFQCDRCENKLFDHYIANCGHKFCHNCRRLVGDGSGRWRCPQCNEFITKVDEQNVEFEERFYEQEVHCSNKKYGCHHRDKLKNILEHIKICDKTKEAALPVEIITTAEIKNIWEEIVKLKRKMEEKADDKDIDNVITELNDKSFMCSACTKNADGGIDKKLKIFKIEMIKSMDDLNKKMDAFNVQVESIKRIEEQDFNYAKNKMENIKTDISYQKNTINLQVDNYNHKFEKITQSLDQLNDKHNAAIERIEREMHRDKIEILAAKEQLEQLEEKNYTDKADIFNKLDLAEGDRKQLKDVTEVTRNQLNEFKNIQNTIAERVGTMETKMQEEIEDTKIQILAAKEQIKNEVDAVAIVKRLDDGEGDRKQLKDSIEIVKKELSGIVSLRNDVKKKRRQMELNIEDLKENLFPRVQLIESTLMLPIKRCNILLLGESGSGKSLFINALANYSRYTSLDEAIDSKKPITLIPSRFRMLDDNGKEHAIAAGEDDGNEIMEWYRSATIKCKSHEFQFRNVHVRLTDTPGVGNTDGEAVDKENMAHILQFINTYDHFHAIAIVMRNTYTEITDEMKCGLRLLLSNIPKTAMDNIVFILTFSQDNHFRPGPVINVLKYLFEDEFKDWKLDLNINNVFCFDNRSYKYLIIVNQGIEFDEYEHEHQNKCWEMFSAEMKRLISHVTQLTPCKLSSNETGNFNQQTSKKGFLRFFQ